MQKTGWGNSSKWYNKIVGQTGHYYHQQVVLPRVMKILSATAGESVLDVGCGQGVLARALLPTVEYTGIDISGALINEAKRLDNNPKHTFLVMDAAKPVKLGKKFDHAAIVLALQNIKDSDGVITNVANLLKPKADLVIVLNHPCFRIPRQSGWSVDLDDKLQKRWISRYMSTMEIPITTHPSQSSSSYTWSFHRPLSDYIRGLSRAGFLVSDIEELVSDKESLGKLKKMENRSRGEIPLFMVIRAILQA